MRVHELAKELGVTSKELLAALGQMGAEGKSASSSVPDDLVPRLRASGGKATAKPAKPREVLEPPPTPRKRKPAAKPAAAKPAAPAPAAAPAAAPVAAPAKPAPKRLERKPEPVAAAPGLQVVVGATPQTLAEKLDRSPAEIVKVLFMAGEMVTATTSLSSDAIKLVATEFGTDVAIVDIADDLKAEDVVDDIDEAALAPRAPVVTIMGHVDHGKTRLLDAIRSTDVVAGEFGGITQHIGAYQAHVGEREITFIDTPGHEAFTAMRARGASVTDIAVLVVAADDGVMPQTLEALDHAKAAQVPIVVAVNKVDKDEADPNRVRTQMVEHGIVPSEWGGDFEFVDVSAKTNQNLEGLLDTILVVADLQELQGDPTGHARGTVLEAHLDKGRGPVATVLVQKGTLDVGDALVAGTAFARIRAMLDENGVAVHVAGPSKPVQILGWNQVPSAGDDFREVQDEREARHIAEEREARARAAELVTSRRRTLEDLMRQVERSEVVDLVIIVKADVQGSLQALTDSLLKLPQEEVRVQIVRGAVGGITQDDVTLAMASDAIIVGFNVRPDATTRELAEKEGVDVRLYRVIYDAIDDIKAALSGLLKPEERERVAGEAEVRQTFRVPRLGVIAGSYVRSGTIKRNALARLIRDGVVVYDGRIASLRRFKDDVGEVRDGFECGIGLANYQDLKDGDVIETYEVEEIARSI
ncbi:MAG TPA: translation initiation factor IF-2 [Actinomycetota bacterium]|nr:translation initiation factor IF-2 [Actinomycetota bacterium]